MTETILEGAVSAIQDCGPIGCCSIMEHDAEAIARAVLQAIREVDDETVVAGCVQVPTTDWEQADIKDAFTAMIDSILSQSQEGK